MMLLQKGCSLHTAFEDYILEGQIGEGGNGRVFSATDKDGSQYAIKFISTIGSSIRRKRLRNEIRFCEQHQHPNIIRILDHGFSEFDNGPFAYYIMPKYNNTLRDKMKAEMMPEDVLTVIRSVLAGLNYAHINGVIHRDIKPENILFLPNSFEAVLCDFGIAHFSEEALYTAVETKNTDRLANFYYAAPEQRIRGGEVSASTDLYAVGLIINELFTGQIPLATNYKKIADINPDYAYLDLVVEKLFRQDPCERLQSASDVLTEISICAERFNHKKDAAIIEKQLEYPFTYSPIKLRVIKMHYDNGVVFFEMNDQVPDEWLWIITERDVSFGPVERGQDNSRLQKYGDRTIGMPIDDDITENQIRRMASSLSSWVEKTNKSYNQKLLQRADQKRNEARKERETALKRVQKDEQIDRIIASLNN